MSADRGAGARPGEACGGFCETPCVRSLPRKTPGRDRMASRPLCMASTKRETFVPAAAPIAVQQAAQRDARRMKKTVVPRSGPSISIKATPRALSPTCSRMRSNTGQGGFVAGKHIEIRRLRAGWRQDREFPQCRRERLQRAHLVAGPAVSWRAKSMSISPLPASILRIV